MSDSQLELSGSVREELAALRLMLVKARHALIEAEAELAETQATVHAFRIEFRRRIGSLVDAVQALQDEMRTYLARLSLLRRAREEGISFEEAEAYWEAEQAAEEDGDEPVPVLDADDAAELKRLYRQLARRFHPDFAVNPTDRAYRTNIMAAVNDAYAARNVAELQELLDSPYASPNPSVHQSEAQVIQTLRSELARCQQRLREIQKELEALREQHVGRLAADAAEAQAQGRDLLDEIAAELEVKLERLSAERDFLKLQFEQMEPPDGTV